MIINIKVIPNSSINKIIEQNGDEWKVKLTAPAVEGRANEALIEFLSKKLKIKKREIEILKGETTRHKIIKISRL